MTEDDAVTMLHTMPAWAALTDDDRDGVAHIEAALAALATLDDDALRRVVVRYLDDEAAMPGGLSLPAASRLYVLVRYVYAAPARAPGGQPAFAGFAGVPHGPDWIDEQWPLSIDASQHLRLTGGFRGYQGEEYLALAELDAFRARYPRRAQP